VFNVHPKIAILPESVNIQFKLLTNRTVAKYFSELDPFAIDNWTSGQKSDFT